MVKVRLGDDCEFRRIAYDLLVVERVSTVPVAAEAIGLTRHALYARLAGRSKFRPEEARRLIAFVNDPRLLAFYVDGSRFVVARRPQPHDPPGNVARAAGAVLHEVTDIMDIVTAAISDGPGLDHREQRLALDEVAQAETALANLRAVLERKLTRPGGAYRPAPEG